MELQQTHVERTELQDHAAEVDPTVSVEAAGLQEMLREDADTFDVTGFKCVNCGLVHSHDTTKHRLSDDFDISEEDAASLDSNSVCHCGVQEAGRHGDELGIDEDRAASVAEQAPIPPESSRELNEAFGTL